MYKTYITLQNLAPTHFPLQKFLERMFRLAASCRGLRAVFIIKVCLRMILLFLENPIVLSFVVRRQPNATISDIDTNLFLKDCVYQLKFM